MTKAEMDNYVRFREVAMDEIPDTNFGKYFRPKNRWETFIEEFIASEFQAAEINIAEGRTAKKEYQSLYNYLKKTGMRDLFQIIVRGDQLYILNKEAAKNSTKKASNKRKAMAKKTSKAKTEPKKKRGRPRKLTPEESLVGSEYIGIYKGSESAEVDRI